MLFINYYETEEAMRANDALEEAIENNNHDMINQLMSTKIDNRILRPSVRCLSEAIFQNNNSLIVTLLKPPYIIVPNLNCLHYSADRYNSQLFIAIIKLYPRLREQFIRNYQPSIQGAIGYTNIKLVKYLVETLRIPLTNDLFEYIQEEPAIEQEPFSLEQRSRRNLYLIDYLRTQMRIREEEEYQEEEIDDEEEEQDQENIPPISQPRRRLNFDLD